MSFGRVIKLVLYARFPHAPHQTSGRLAYEARRPSVWYGAYGNPSYNTGYIPIAITYLPYTELQAKMTETVVISREEPAAIQYAGAPPVK